MRRVIAIVIIGLVMAIALTLLPKQQPGTVEAERHRTNYFSRLQECGAACVPLAAVLVVVTE